MMVFVFIIVILDSLFRIFEVLLEVFDPLGNDTQDSIRFHKENSIIDLLICVWQGIFRDFSANQVLCISFDFLPIFQIFVIDLSFFSIIFPILKFSSLVNGKEYLLECIFHKAEKSIILFVAFADHKVYHSHNLISVISILSEGESQI